MVEEEQPPSHALQKHLISFITPVRNGEKYLDECFQSIIDQTYTGPMELCVFDDGSTDRTVEILRLWEAPLLARGVALKLLSSPRGSPARGCGYGRNRAILDASNGSFLSFLDADDVMAPRRVEAQLNAAIAMGPRALIGCKYWRDSAEARPRDTAWHNGMSQAQLVTQRLRETTLAQPTWFCARAAFDAVGGYLEARPNEAEDLAFFYAHLNLGGTLHRVDEALLMYRHGADSVTASRSVPRDEIFAIRMAQLELVLSRGRWAQGFTIWSAGKEGRKVYRALSAAARSRVVAFCDVSPALLERGWYEDHSQSSSAKKTARCAAKRSHDEADEDAGRGVGSPGGAAGGVRRVPIVHFREAEPPLLLCVKLGLTGEGEGCFEENFRSLGLEEGEDNDYLHFA